MAHELSRLNSSWLASISSLPEGIDLDPLGGVSSIQLKREKRDDARHNSQRRQYYFPSAGNRKPYELAVFSSIVEQP